MVQRKRDRKLQVRLTAEERDRIDAAVIRTDACSITEWLLAVVRISEEQPQLIARAATEVRAEEARA